MNFKLADKMSNSSFLLSMKSRRKIFILGPSHRIYLNECALPEVDTYETPLGNLRLDKQIINELKENNHKCKIYGSILRFRRLSVLK